MVFDYKILPVQNEILNSPHEIKGFSRKRKSVTRKFKKDRRRLKLDRRKGVRDGVIVSLSSKSNRRKGWDRRQTSGALVQENAGTGFVV